MPLDQLIRTMLPDGLMRTARLTLRTIEDRDAAALVAGLGDIEVARWLSRVPFPYTLAEARRFIVWERSVRHEGEERVVAIEIRDVLPKTMIGKLSRKELQQEERDRAAGKGGASTAA